MRTIIAFLIALFLLVGAVSAIAQDQLSSPQESIASEQDPKAPISAYPIVACDGNSSFGIISVIDHPDYTDAATVALLNVGKNDFLVCNGTLQTVTNAINAGNIGVRVEVRDGSGRIFYADPEPAGGFPFFAPVNEDPNIRSGTWWINPSARSGFVLGNVMLSLQAQEYPEGDAIIGFRSFCCQKIYNSPTSQTRAVVVPLFD